MGLNRKERKELIQEIQHKYKNKKYNKWTPGITYGDIAGDMGHSDRREIADVSEEIVRESK